MIEGLGTRLRRRRVHIPGKSLVPRLPLTRSFESPLEPLLHVEFDLHPLGSKADQRIRATLLPVQVTYDGVSLITDDGGSSTFVIPSGVSFSFLPKGKEGGRGTK